MQKHFGTKYMSMKNVSAWNLYCHFSHLCVSFTYSTVFDCFLSLCL